MLEITSPITVTVAEPPQLSDEITPAGFAAGTWAAHWTVVFGAHVIVGAVLSNTVIVWLHDAELPQASVALYVRVTTKLLAQIWPDITSPRCVTVADPPQLSDDVTLAGFTAGTWLAHCTDTLAGQVIVGAVLSRTVIVCVHDEELPHASVAVYVLTTLNRLVQVIFVITSPACTIVVLPPQLSVAVTNAGFGAGTWLAHCTVLPPAGGHVTAGGVLSNTVSVCVHDAELPQASVAL
jgi:hypothetical protein